MRQRRNLGVSALARLPLWAIGLFSLEVPSPAGGQPAFGVRELVEPHYASFDSAADMANECSRDEQPIFLDGAMITIAEMTKAGIFAEAAASTDVILATSTPVRVDAR